MTHYYSNIQTLLSMGWSQAFQQHLTLDEVTALEQEDMQLARISAIHRNRIQAQTAKEEINLLCPNALQPVSQHLGVGAWVIFEQKHEHNLILRIIPAKNQIERLSGHSKQLIAANLDYLWIVTSANTEFNINRLQRYLALGSLRLSHLFSVLSEKASNKASL